MVDTLTQLERSERMSRIRGRDTGPELVLRKLLHAAGFRYRLHRAGLPGRPDLVFARYRAVVFVHGCFWHRHAGCSIASMPKSNIEFWTAKFQRNVLRDASVQSALESSGWRVCVAWECNLSTKSKALITARRIGCWLRGQADEGVVEA